MHEIAIGQVGSYRHLFPGPEMNLLAGALLAGNAKGRLWVTTGGTGALLWDQCNNVLYLGGEIDGSAGLPDLIRDTVHPASLASGRPWIRAHGLTEQARTAFTPALDGLETYPDRRLHFWYRAAVCRPQPIDGVTVKLIDRAFVEQEHPANTEEILEEIGQMWPSLDRFYENVFGFAAVAGGTALCWCTAEYVSQGLCGIGIATVSEARRRGIGTLTAATFVAYCLERSILPHWDCSSRNVPSERLARKVGFAMEGESETVIYKIA